MSDDDEKVGYGRPPKATRFAKGQSGNPSGRPKRQKTSLELLRRELEKKVTVIEHGRQRRLTKAELITRQYVNGAVKGDKVALRMMASLLTALDADLQRRGETEVPPKERQQVDQALIDVIAALASTPDAEA